MQAGSHDTWTLNGVLSGPLNDTLGVRLAAQQHRSDGFLRNEFLDRGDTNRRDERAFRGKLRWQAGANTTVDALLGYVDIDNGYDAFSLDNDRTVLSDEPGRDAQQALFGSVTLSWSGAAIGVEGAISAAEADSIYGYDEDWTYAGFHPFGYSSTDYYFRDRRSLTGEIRVLSQAPSPLFGGATDWSAGLYALDRREDLNREYTFAAPFGSRFEVRRAALFGQLQSAVGARHTLTAGLRYERHESTYTDSTALAFSPTDNLYGWRLALDRRLDNDMMAYGSISRGYKAGGFNTDGSLDADLRQYDPETLMNYEAGLKGEVFNGRLDTRLAVFHMRRQDVQIASSLTRVRGDGSSEFIQYTGNAATGRNTGVEAQFRIRPMPALEVTATLGLLRSEYRTFVNAAGESLDGREQAHAPGYQFALRAHYDFGGGWYAALGAEGRDAFYFSDSHGLRSRVYELFDAAVGLARGSWEVRLWGRNLTNAEHAVRGYFFGNDPRTDYMETGYVQLGAPRTWGVNVSWAVR
jgi:outer membrane receptor protein involved in Fe transport